MMKFPKLLVAVVAVPLFLAACGEDENKTANTGNTNTGTTPAPAPTPAPKADTAPGSTVTTDAVVAKCTENMKLAAAQNDQMKALTGKEDKMCACVVDKVKADTSLSEQDRNLIYAGLQTAPGSDESRTAQTNMTEASTKAIGTAMQACRTEVTTE